MNKKFSTLLASVLLAGGFSFSAQAAGMPNDVKAGDYVSMATGGNLLTISNGSLNTKALSEILNGNAFKEGKTFKDLFNTLWRVEVIKPAETSAALSYRFVNKQTGEYLAIKLQTNKKGTSTDVAKIDATGNKEWSVDTDGHLYAYVPNATAGKDSTFYLDASLKLVAKQGLPGTLTGAAFTIALPTDYITLTADAFNDVMALPGNGGKLYFNNGKDVTSNETNILKDTKWEAIEFAADNNSFALWNGKTKKGLTNKMEKDADDKYIKIDKKEFLMVDTIYQDKANKYFALATDTVPYETYEKGTGYDAGSFTASNNAKDNTNLKRRTASAEFTGTYYYGNDSLVLNAVKVPQLAIKTPSSEAPAHYTWTGADGNQANLDGINTLFTNATAAANKTTLTDAVTALHTALTDFAAVADRTADVEFGNAELIDAVENAKFANNTTLDTWLAKFDGLTFVAGQVATYSTVKPAVDGYAQGSDTDDLSAEFELLSKALETWHKAVVAGAISTAFADSYFNADASEVKGAVTIDFTKADAASGVLGSITGTTSYETNDPIAKAITDQFSGLTVTAAKYTNATGDVADVTTEFAIGSLSYTNEDAIVAAITKLKAQENVWALTYGLSATTSSMFASTKFDVSNQIDDLNGSEPSLTDLDQATAAAISSLKSALADLAFAAATGDAAVYEDYFFVGKNVNVTDANDGQVILRKLGNGMVLTVVNDGELDAANMEKDGTINGYTLPLMQPYATMAGDAVIATNNLYFWQIKNEIDPKVTDLFKVYNYEYNTNLGLTKEIASADTSAYNPATQWAIVKGATDGYYQIINRETKAVKYVGPVFVVKDEDGDAIADTYVAGTDTLKLIAVDRTGLSFVTESKVAYDYNGYFYAGADNDKVNRTFKITSVSPYLKDLYMQSKKDSVVVLGEDAVVWSLETVDKSAEVYGAEVTGIENLKRVKYNVSMTDADGNKYYIYNKDNVFTITRSDSKDAKDNKASFFFKAVAQGQYLLVNTKADDDSNYGKMTINPTPKQPIMESSLLTSEKNDIFTIEQTNLNVYRELGVTKADDGLMLNGVDSAKIFMENEPTRFLYENSANIVANNGNKVAKDSLNFLGIYNAAATVSEAALFIDTAYVDRKDNYMPQYMIGLRQSYQEAGTIIDCPDNNPNCTDPSHRKATKAYRTADYLVSLSDSVPAGVKTHPSLYDGSVRLAFVPATHIADTVIISSSKYVGTKHHDNDSLLIENNKPNKATFALRIKDQETKSFYMETVGGAFVRILNGVPVLTDKIGDAAIFNIAKTTEAPVANESIDASEVSVVATDGAVIVKGAEGKKVVITNLLGQTIANKVITSSEATIAAPKGYVTVAIEGEAAVKAIVK